MGVAAAVLATTGVAAAAGGWVESAPKRASVHSSKPASAKPAQSQDKPARRVPAGSFTQPKSNPVPRPKPNPAPPQESVLSPEVAQPEAPGLNDLSHEAQPTTAKPTDIREYVRNRLEDGTWR
jgi:hypothetical protein